MLSTNLRAAWLAVNLLIVTGESDALLKCPQSAADSQGAAKTGNCHFQTQKETWGLSWFEDSCQEDCDKRWSLIQAATPEKECLPFCLDNGCPCLKPWADRCTLNSCANCPECVGPTGEPTEEPVMTPTESPTAAPSELISSPTEAPSAGPTHAPTEAPTVAPTAPVCTVANVPLQWSKGTQLHSNLGDLGPDNGLGLPPEVKI